MQFRVELVEIEGEIYHEVQVKKGSQWATMSRNMIYLRFKNERLANFEMEMLEHSMHIKNGFDGGQNRLNILKPEIKC